MGVPLPHIINPMMNPLNFALTQLVLTIPVILAGHRFYSVGIKTLLKGSPNMDSLIAIGTGAAVLYGIFATYMIIGGAEEYAMDLYFESAAVIITLILLGKYLESVSKGKTSEAIKKLMGLQPKTALVIREGKEKGYTLIPTKVYIKRGRAKLEFAIAKGKKNYDKREVEKKNSMLKEAKNAMKQSMR